MNWKGLERLRTRFLQFDERDARPGTKGIGKEGVSPKGTGKENLSSKGVGKEGASSKGIGGKALTQGEEDSSPVAPDRSDYWGSHSELASYDFTFGERIGWKWDSVIAELQARGWTPPEGIALDWGCGTGVAGRRVAQAWPQQIKALRVSDRSNPAQRFAAKKAVADGIEVQSAATAGESAPKVLIVSHVLNELPPEALETLLALAERAEVVLWVEPGTFPVSRQLIAARERLKAHFHVIAPCPHQGACGLEAPGNERHWCHHFAKVPGFVHTDPGWGHFSRVLNVDLSTLAMSFLVLDRRPEALAAPAATGESRILGEPRYYKGYSKILSCQAEDVQELTLQKRDAHELLKAMKKDPGTLYRWERDGDKIRSGERIF